ncbi:hydantoinase/oxoprolinase family protein [Phytohabitans suffuscus]|uniref:5-oxoprolinase n=1 Tax=Phytohabitans suffuscus TaxID=624315 RepID=A0A6F8YV32_9ACTN|nr:hydantoinase/oxoprolinase family protein [Phytohabitans suffuscus]BCB89916.1 5-oxoprolinase [Phytohabitans suffuscus]
MRLQIGIDVGGTFTDVVASDRDSGRTWRVKVPSDPRHTTGSVLTILDLVRERSGARPGEVETLTVGHTIGLNALLERTGARTALVTTAGFRDVLAIGRESRPKLFDLQQDPRPVLVPRYLRFEVDERMDPRGEVVRPLSATGAERVVGQLLAEKVEAVAVCFLHAYANPAHEIAFTRLLQERAPQLAVCASHEVLSEQREYERTVLAVQNAYLLPKVRTFVDEVRAALAGTEPHAELFITDSAGGAMSAALSRDRAIHAAFSGPAAGVRATASLGELIGERDLITIDIGGTSCDVGLIRDGQPELSNRTTLGGLPVGLRMVDIKSVSSGGGSIAWVDSGGLLRVGPRSSGAVPGPACYDRGGTAPTVTDAHLLLGHLDPEATLGGTVRLRTDLARAAIEEHVARPLGMDVTEAAAGILAIAEAELVRAIEVISVSRGHDPRESVLVAFGGAGPLHSGSIARTMGIRRTVVPGSAGVLCAFGALSAGERYEFSQTLVRGGVPAHEVFALLRARAAEAIPGGIERFTPEYILDMRYVGQTSTIPVTVTDPGADDLLDVAHKTFEELYLDVFGYGMPRPSEVDAVRLVVHRERAAVDHRVPTASDPAWEGRPWRAHFGPHGFLDCAMVAVESLPVGAAVAGPAIVTAASTTTVVQPGDTATVDPWGNLIVTQPFS